MSAWTYAQVCFGDLFTFSTFKDIKDSLTISINHFNPLAPRTHACSSRYPIGQSCRHEVMRKIMQLQVEFISDGGVGVFQKPLGFPCGGGGLPLQNGARKQTKTSSEQWISERKFPVDERGQERS